MDTTSRKGQAEPGGRHVAIDDTRLYVVERGQGYPVLVLHGGPGLDHHMFGDYLDPLTDRYRMIFVDLRSNGRSDRAPESTWTLEQMSRDVGSLARALLRSLRSAAARGRLSRTGRPDDRLQRHPIVPLPGARSAQSRRF